MAKAAAGVVSVRPSFVSGSPRPNDLFFFSEVASRLPWWPTIGSENGGT